MVGGEGGYYVRFLALGHNGHPMSFFGFETDGPQHSDSGQNQAFVEEDVAVYTWGDVSYDTLGDALQEAGDDLNDETFGGGSIG